MDEALEKGPPENQGFTLIEVIVVIILLAVLSATAMVRLSGFMTTVRDSSEIDVLKFHLRYAQIRALNTQGVWGIDFDGSDYNLYREGSAAVQSFPGESGPTVIKPSSITYSGYISFDDWGRPYTSQGAVTPLTSTPAGFDSVVITPETGYIP